MASSLFLKRLVSSNLLSRSSGRRLFSSNAFPVHDLGSTAAHRRRDDGNGYFNYLPNGLRLRMEMPGLGKEDVNVSLEHNTLTIEGRGVKEFEGRRYSTRVDLPADKRYDVGAEVKDGVLTVMVAAETKEDQETATVAEVEEKEEEEGENQEKVKEVKEEEEGLEKKLNHFLELLYKYHLNFLGEMREERKGLEERFNDFLRDMTEENDLLNDVREETKEERKSLEERFKYHASFLCEMREVERKELEQRLNGFFHDMRVEKKKERKELEERFDDVLNDMRAEKEEVSNFLNIFLSSMRWEKEMLNGFSNNKYSLNDMKELEATFNDFLNKMRGEKEELAATFNGFLREMREEKEAERKKLEERFDVLLSKMREEKQAERNELEERFNELLNKFDHLCKYQLNYLELKMKEEKKEEFRERTRGFYHYT